MGDTPSSSNSREVGNLRCSTSDLSARGSVILAKRGKSSFSEVSRLMRPLAAAFDAKATMTKIYARQNASTPRGLSINTAASLAGRTTVSLLTQKKRNFLSSNGGNITSTAPLEISANIDAQIKLKHNPF